MPFTSEKQRKYLYANKPEVAMKYAKHGKKKVKKKKSARKGLLESRGYY